MIELIKTQPPSMQRDGGRQYRRDLIALVCDAMLIGAIGAVILISLFGFAGWWDA